MSERNTPGRKPGTPKTGGRQKGTPNKVTGTLRDFYLDLINANRGKIEQDLKKLKPKDRLAFIEKITSFVLPKMQSVSAEVDLRAKLESMTDDQLNEVIDSVLEKAAEQNQS